MYRISIAMILCGLLAAQQTSKPTEKKAEPQQEPAPIRVTVDYVTTPVLVFDRDGQYVNGLREDQFRLFDNGKEQDAHVDVSYTPISLVICIQSNSHVQGLLPQVKKIGNLITPLLIGDQGEAAIIAYDGRIRTLQEFTSDPELITKAVAKIYPGSDANRMIDAVSAGTMMLRSRARNRRRILLVIGETRDLSSETRAREALIDLQVNNIIFYAVDMSRFMTTLLAPTPVGRPDNLPPAMHPLPSGVPATPTTVAQAYGQNAGRAEFIPMMVEIFKDVKAIFKDNPVEVFTKGTGGSEFGFHSQRTLEQAFQRMGEELHSEYLISYSPNNRDEAGFHEIVVDVPGRSDVKRVQTRPGYWLGPRQ
jgi:VWFA-related protein